jgi:WD40 repeat protein
MTRSAMPDVTAPRVFDVFLSHNSREKAAVERVAEWLKRMGIEPWLDKWCLTPGGDWQDELADGLRRSCSCAVFVGPGGIGNWERMEFKLATDRMANDRNFRVFPVLLPDLPEQFDTSILPPFLSTRTWVDMRRGVTDSRSLQMLVNAVKGVAPGPETPIEPQEDVCPYRGLRAFNEEHSEFFFGREGDVQRLVEKLKSTRFMAVLGPSGSGKSSVVRAGLIPALRKGALPGSDDWPVRVFTPGARPLTALAANLVRLHPHLSALRTLDELAADERTLHLATSVALAERPPSERVVWVIDQFEEVFTLCRDETELVKFIANLLFAAAVPGGRCMVVFTLRADFYQKCAAYPELSAQLAAQQFIVSPISAEGLRQAIAEPAWRVGLEFEPGLVETILDAVASEPGALPLLEHALLELWERRRGRLLTLEAYRETGGVEGAIAKRADAIFESFDSEGQSITRRVMLRLTQPGEGTEDTRRRATLDELITRSDEAENIRAVVTALANARLLTTDRSAGEGSDVIDVSHEALIRGWPRLRRWVEEDRQGLRTHRRLTEAAQEWKCSGSEAARRDEGLLFRGARLALTAEWRERNQTALNELEKEFLDASVESQVRARSAAQRRTRRIIVGLVAAIVLITAASVYAFYQSRRAAQGRTEALARELAANASAQLPSNPELGLLLAVEAARKVWNVETEDTLRQALIKSPARVFDVGAASNFTAISSPDSKKILVTSGKKVQVWEIKSGRKLFELQPGGESEDVGDAKFSLDGRLLATTAGDEVQIWDAVTGASVSKWAAARGNRRDMINITFSPDDKFLLVEGATLEVKEVDGGRVVTELDGADPTFIRNGETLLLARYPSGVVGTETDADAPATEYNIYDTKTWKPIDRIPPGGGQLTSSVAISNDGKLIAWVSVRELRVQDLRDGSLRLRQEKSSAESLQFSPDGNYLVARSFEGLDVWDLTGDRGKSVLGDSAILINSFSFSPDSRLILLRDSSAQLYLYQVKSQLLLARIGAASSAALRAEFSPDGNFILATNEDGKVFLWDVNAWHSKVETLIQGGRVSEPPYVVDAALSPDSRYVVTVESSDPWERSASVAKVFEVSSGRQVMLLDHGEPVKRVEFSSDGKHILTADVLSKVWDAKSGELLKMLNGGALTFGPGGRIIVFTTNNVVKVFDAGVFERDGPPAAELQADDELHGAVLSPDGRYIFIYVGRVARLYDLSGRRLVREIQRADLSAVFSPDSKTILTWISDRGKLGGNVIEVWDISMATLRGRLQGQSGFIYSVSFSPDGRYVVTTSGYTLDRGIASGDTNEVRIWDLSGGRTIYEFRGYEGVVLKGGFSPDGKSVVAFVEDGTALVYDCQLCATKDELLNLASERNYRELTQDERVRYLRD